MMKTAINFFLVSLLFYEILFSNNKIKPGGKCPNFSVKSIYDKEYSIPQKSEKKNVLLLFADKNCDSCFDLMCFLNDYLKQFNTTEFEIWVINKNANEIKKIANEIDENLFIFINDPNKTVNKIFNVSYYPFCVLINKKDKISAIHVGFNENEEKSERRYSLVYILNAYLSKKKIIKIEENKEETSTSTFNIKNK